MSNNEKNNKDKNSIVDLKMVLLGATEVGKTALIHRFINDSYPEEYDATIEEKYNVEDYKFDGINCWLQILDTSGDEDYQNMLDTYIEFTNCYLLIYSINNENSFKEVKTKYERICQVKEKEKENIIVVLVGNKCDLPINERKVSTNEAEEYANKNGMKFLESSALNRINTKEVFNIAIKKFLEKNKDKEDNEGWCPCF